MVATKESSVRAQRARDLPDLLNRLILTCGFHFQFTHRHG